MDTCDLYTCTNLEKGIYIIIIYNIYIYISRDGAFVIHPQRMLYTFVKGNLSQNVSTSQGVNKSEVQGDMYQNKPN